MTPDERRKWNSRPMIVTVKEICPRCNTLQEGVLKRTIHGSWGQKLEETVCCAACVPALQEEYSGLTIC